MAWQHTPYAYPILFATALSLVLGVYTIAQIRRRGRSTTLLTFAAMTGAIAIWTAFSALKLLSTDPTLKFHSYRLLHIGSAAVGPLLVLFALAYTDRTRWLTRSVSVGVFVVPFVFIVLLFTNPYDVATLETRVVETNGLVVFRAERGPARVALSFVYAALMAVLTLAIVLYKTVRTGKAYYMQAVLMTVAVIAPMAASFLTVLGLPPFGREGVNLVPAAAGISVAALGVATFRYRLLDLPELAYTTAIRDSPDGILVLDADERIVQTNASARRLLGLTSSSIGHSVDSALPEVNAETADDQTIEVTTVDGTQVLDLRSQPFRSQGATVGRVVVLRDVTAQKRYEQSLELRTEQGELLNRLVRHDIRNEMDVVLGLLRRIDTKIAGLHNGDSDAEKQLAKSTERIEQNCKHVVDLTETVGEILQTIAQREHEPVPVELVPVLENEIAAVTAAFDNATIETESEIPTVTVRADEMLSSLFYNLLTNAIVHNDNSMPMVSVSARETTGWIAVSIADNGPGLPERAKRSLVGETPLTEYQESGYGLYIVRSLADGYGAELSVTENQPTGTVVTVRFQRGDTNHVNQSEQAATHHENPSPS